MKIVSIQGSPRRSQNTAAIMGKILEGARSSGAEITQFTINEMKIHPCLACDQCKKNRLLCRQRRHAANLRCPG